uniref:DUF4210 domain-containing protein n=1 Tax=Meloidogyne hapla TaxID=6305 RepID=A0A1I8B4D4_MELHA
MDCNDSWVLPPLPDTNNGQNQQDEQVQRSGSSLSSSLCSSSDSDEDIQDEDENELSSSSSSSSIPPHSQININEQISHQKKDSGSEGEYNKNNNASCSNNLNNNSSLSRRNSQNIQTSSLQFVNEIQNLRERSQHHHRLRSSRPIQSSNNNNSTTINLPSLPKHSQLLQQYHHHHHQFIQRRRLVLQRARKAAKKINDGPSIEVDNKQNQKEDKMEEDKAEKVKIENKEIREENKIVNNNNGGIEKMEYSSPQIQQQPQPSSQCSTPPPPFHHPLLRGVNTTPRVLLQQRQHSSLSALHNNKNSNNSFRRCSSARLVCNFEESILSGRLTPSSIVDGYSLQLMVVPTQSMVMAPGGGFFSVQRVKYPVQTFFYFNEMGSTPDEISTRTPALLHLARCELDSDGIPIPRHCNLQAVLFNPQGSVIKIFMVEVDVRDMPNCSTTFIRQRTFSETLTTKTGINNNYFPSSTSSDFTANKNLNIKNNTGLMTSMMSSLTMPNTTNNRMPSPASALRFLIHLRLASNEAGCIRLHTDIRMLFSNKSTELEGLDRRLLLAVADNKNRLSLPPGILESKTNCEGSTRMHTIAEMPVGPKYSPVK